MFADIDDQKKIKFANFLMELEDPVSIDRAITFLTGLKKEVDNVEDELLDPRKSISNIIIYLLSKCGDPKKLE